MPGRNCVAVAALAVGLIAAPVLAAPLVTVSVAYYDTEHASPTVPVPWQGSPNTTFFGNPDANGVWDTGGILVTNSGPGDTVINTGLIVDGFANGASFRLWDSQLAGGLTVHPGQNVIFAGPGSGTFDSSDQPIINDPTQRTNNHPVVHITIGNTRYNFTDAMQVLNTGGFDPGEAYHVSESLPWTQVGVVPEPSAGAAAGSAACALGLFRRRAANPR